MFQNTVYVQSMFCMFQACSSYNEHENPEHDFHVPEHDFMFRYMTEHART